ncbi:MAG TPA: NAD-dependent epimerase/dehydratase family protein [Daejeonella sp.]|nr:NAD-dependent epimerase/dehydratase family protein [Daejeonella sp.]
MQTILGAGGAISRELAKALKNYTSEIRLVSRNPQKVNETDSLFAADLANYDEVKNAVKDSEVVYLTAGLPYETKTWQKTWPLIMQNVINACIENNSRLVFFDNIYAYEGTNLNPITETSPINPPSKKGEVRAQLIQMIWDAVEQKGLVALIARCADFYGPSIKNNSLLTETVIKPLSEGKTANWLANANFKHSFTYTVDAGKATALLGNTPDAFGQTWHLPTAKNPLTGKEWVEALAAQLGVKPKYRIIGKTMIRLLGFFIPIMRETYEMLYQYDRDYVFNSDKFENRFSFKPTSYLDGIKEIVKTDYKK